MTTHSMTLQEHDGEDDREAVLGSETPLAQRRTRRTAVRTLLRLRGHLAAAVTARSDAHGRSSAAEAQVVDISTAVICLHASLTSKNPRRPRQGWASA